MKKLGIVTPDPWAELGRFTQARIGLGRCGSSLPLSKSLEFRMAWAKAKDAVLQPLDRKRLAGELNECGLPTCLLASTATDRKQYLMRPDHGRRLDRNSQEQLNNFDRNYDLCLVICDGLSSPAVQNHSLRVLCGFAEKAMIAELSCSPVFIVKNGRVAIGDEIGEGVGAKMTILLVGERPGLTSPDSLGAYLTWAPAIVTTDEARNCISNIRSGGLAREDAIRKLCYLVEESFRLKRSGVGLKDRMGKNYLPFAGMLTG